jgi:hypothetical protein
MRLKMVKISKIIGFMFVLITLMVTAKAALGAVVINEVMANPLDEDTGEFVELYNNGLTDVDINGWLLIDTSDSLEDYTGINDRGLSGTTIPANGYAIVVDKEYAGEYNDYIDNNVNLNEVIMITIDDTTFGSNELTNSGDTVLVSDNIAYVSSFTWTSDVGNGISWEKIDHLGFNLASNWQASILGGTPGATNNDAPVTVNVNGNTNEDTEVIVTLSSTDADANDQAQSCTLSSIVSGTETTACACTAGVCTAGLTPDQDSNLDITADYIVNDGEVNSNTAQITVTVNALNDVPVAANVNENTDEDTEVIITLSYTEVDTGDLAERCTLSSIVSGTETTACVCAVGVCTVGLTPDQDSNTAITADYTVYDGVGDSNLAQITINVNPINDAPESADYTITTNEDVNYTFVQTDFAFNDVDTVDVLASIKITTLESTGKLTLSGNDVTLNQDVTLADIVAGNLFYASQENENGAAYATFQFSVNDGTTDSALSYTITIDVTAVNDAPTITNVAANQNTIVEEVDFSYTITATDIDNNVSELEIDTTQSTVNGAALSTATWISVVDNLTLSGTPKIPGDYTFNLVVTDNGAVNQYSEIEELNITVIPALQINEDTLTVTVDGTSASTNSTINVSLGDLITVNLPFTNNYNQELGRVSTEARVSAAVAGLFDSEELPYEGTCVSGNNCENGYWVLNSGDNANDELSFHIPTNLNQDFSLTLEVYDDGFWDFLFGHSILHTKTLNFHIDREPADVQITEVEISDENLTCSRTTTLDLTIVNTGDSGFDANDAPDILIYDKAATESSFNENDGVYTSFSGTPLLNLKETVGTIAAGQEKQVSIDVDAINLTNNGEHTLYIYVVNPHFENYLADKEEVKVNVDSCLNVTALEELFVLPRNSANGKSANLDNYINEDSTGYTFSYTVSEQSELDLIECGTAPVGSSNLACKPPHMGNHGTSVVTVSIDETNALSPLEESFTVTVTPGLEVSNVKINSITVEEDEETTSLKPQEDITVSYTLTNHLDRAVTSISSSVISQNAAMNLLSEDPINLAAGESMTLQLQTTLSHLLTEGDYDATLEIEGLDYNDNTLVRSDSFPFILNIEQDAADVIISNLTIEDENGITCKTNTRLTVELTNRGSNDEDDVIVEISGSDFEHQSQELTLAKNDKKTYKLEIPAANLTSGNNQLQVTVSYRNDFESVSDSISVIKGNCLASFIPTQTELTVADGKQKEFNVTLSEEGYENVIRWYLDEEEVVSSRGDSKYIFSQTIPGEYEVKVVINANEEESQTWKVIVTNVPVTNSFTTSLPDNPTNTQLANLADFTITNSNGKINFSQNVDLREVSNLDDIVSISNNQVAIDSDTESELNKAATITLNREFSNPVIQKSTGYNEGPFEVCPETKCDVVSNANGEFVFTVTGFSTYKVVEEQTAALQISTINIENFDRGNEINYTVTITNTGTMDTLNSLSIQLVDVNSEYSASLSSLSTTTLDPDSSVETVLTLTVPEDEDSGSHSIGELKVSSVNNNGTTVESSADITLNPISYITIDEIKINGKSSGDLSIEDVNDIEVEISNEYTEDMEDVEVTIEILDVDDDDLDEDADDQDIDAGDSEDFEVEFDLSDEDIDEEEYTIRVTVEGEADDGTKHQATLEKKVDVDIEKHKVIISRTSLGANTMQCVRQNNVRVTIENVGQKDEDELDLFVKNTALGLELRKTSLNLDKFSDSDNEDTYTFYLDLEDANAGTYPIIVELYLDNKLEDSNEVSLEVKECMTSQTQTQQQNQLGTDLATKLQQQLQQQLLAKQAATEPSTTTASFRSTDTYTALLGVLVFLVVVAMILAMAVLMKKKK